MKGKLDIILGLQWGDEGKGKVIDVLSPHYKMVARFQGGPNAGHTIEYEGNKYILKNIPSGIIRDDTLNVIGNGVVIDPVIFKAEIESLDKDIANIKHRLIISNKANIIIPTHKWLDAAYEKYKSTAKLGTTGKGIGPAYSDKISRIGLKVADINDPTFPEKYNKLLNYHMALIKALNSLEDINYVQQKINVETAEFLEAVEFLRSLNIVNTEYVLNSLLENGEELLAEGAQGTLLDNDFGTYPYVTSSNTVSASACIGLGIAPNKIGDIYGVFKAYCTRVGEGPFPTELTDRDGKLMQVIGNEYGSVTGRERRCGWLDLVAIKYVCMLNGVTKLIMTKGDVLNTFKNIKVCIGYVFDNNPNEIITTMPMQDMSKAVPYYIDFKGWNSDISEITDYNNLPERFKEYVNYISFYLGIPIVMVSVGSDRNAIIANTSLLDNNEQPKKKTRKRKTNTKNNG